MSQPFARVRGLGRWPRLLAGAVLLVLAFALALGVFVDRLRAGAAARAAFPVEEGRLQVVGLTAPVEVFRDVRGVPHVEATGEGDAYFGLGFVHAQDRLAQMLWLLRAARGRSAEVVGPEAIEADRLARVLELGTVADAEFEKLDKRSQRILESYARGVNARIARIRSGAVAAPQPLLLLGIPLEDWQPADSLAVWKLYSWGLSSTLDVSLVLSDLIEHLGGFGAQRFFPGGAGNGPPPKSDPVTAGAPLEGDGVTLSPLVPDPLRRAARLEGRSIGSSAWVLGGAHTESGLPMLAADAHLEPTAPPLFHMDHVRAGDLDVAGATLPGVPIFWTGHNRNVAWASTVANAVTVDLYSETLHPSREGRYHDGSAWRDLSERSETIRVRGADDEVFTVRSTRHGPLLDGLLGGDREPLSVAWVGSLVSEGSSMAALFGVARAADASALLEALEGLREPVVAMVYADRQGQAGMHVAGWIPRRGLASGLVPLPGRARWFDWQGRVPFAELPQERLEKGHGWAIAADNRLGGTAETSEWLWRTGIRARRIEAGLRAAVAAGPVDLRRLARLQSDVAEGRAGRLVTLVLNLAGAGDLSPEAREVAELLRGWDGRANTGSIGAAAYHVFLAGLTEQLFETLLGEALMDRYLALPQVDPGQVVLEIVRAAVAADGVDAGDWSDARLVREAVRGNLRETWFRLSYRLGANREKWNWGRLHPLRFEPFGRRARRAVDLPDIGPFAYGGSGDTINTAEYDPADPFAVRVASLFRLAVDLGAADQALASLAPGQSEHPRHHHFDDGLERWFEGRPRLLGTSRILVEETSVARLVLEPAG